MTTKSKYKRVMLKLSGEVLLGDQDNGIDFDILHNLCGEIVEVAKMAVEVVVVIGAGNIWRYRDNTGSGIDRVSSDYMGMLATIMNAVAMQSAIEDQGVYVRVCSALNIPQVAEPYLRRRAIRHLEKGRVVICAGGTGNPYFTTDSAAALRALELDCDVLLKATKVDGVYDKDPKKFDDAKRFDTMKYTDVLGMDLEFMDSAAVSLCKDSKLPIIIFDLTSKGNIQRVVAGENIGTVIS
ncbi:MAG: UMP kinase [Candidatus Peregrinibacteria bacterium]|nr:UMP kinase [Candidatus Peregrinibacteria bacterium]MDZ4245055.1 UMP kinase [Candidatus Gracilibacteria bacterium]